MSPSYSNSNIENELNLMLRSRYGLIMLDNPDEERMLSLCRRVAENLGQPLFIWSLGSGLMRSDFARPIADTESLVQALDHLRADTQPGIYFFKGLKASLNDSLSQAKLNETAILFRQFDGAIVACGDCACLPDSLRTSCATMTPPSPNKADYQELARSIFNDLSRRMPVKLEISKGDMDRLLSNLQGLSLNEAEKILTRAMIEDGKLDINDLNLALESKCKLLERDGLLEYCKPPKDLPELAGLSKLKEWLAKRSKIISQPDLATAYGLDFPKGILLLGVPGSGKSLCAKAVATQGNLPLLRMDPAGLYNKYIGESEKNFDRSLQTASSMAPAVLWIDEIEKAFAQGGSEDGGVSQRVLGIFLNWMQERDGDIFVVATANDVSKLPPEILRKGRFDEIFFVDLPTEAQRREIFAIHLKQRGRTPESFDLNALACATEGFSGAEIEQVVLSGLYTAFNADKSLNTQDLLNESSLTVPLSRTRAEQIDALRVWASERAVSAQ